MTINAFNLVDAHLSWHTALSRQMLEKCDSGKLLPAALSGRGNVEQQAQSSLYYLLKLILHLQSVLGGKVTLGFPRTDLTDLVTRSRNRLSFL